MEGDDGPEVNSLQGEEPRQVRIVCPFPNSQLGERSNVLLSSTCRWRREHCLIIVRSSSINEAPEGPLRLCRLLLLPEESPRQTQTDGRKKETKRLSSLSQDPL